MAKVLLADDSVTMQKVVDLVLREQGYEVVTAKTGQEAIEMVASHQPDLVLAYLKMPGIDGYQICQTIKGDPATQGITVILLAGAFDPVDEAQMNQVGANGSMVKPFQAEELVALVKQHLGDAAPVAAAAEADDFMFEGEADSFAGVAEADSFAGVAEAETVAVEPVMEAAPVEAEAVMAEPVMEAAPVMAEPVMEAAPVMAEPVMEAAPVMAEPVMEAEAVMAEPVMEAAPVMAEPVMEAAPVMEEPVMEAAPAAAPMAQATPATPVTPVTGGADAAMVQASIKQSVTEAINAIDMRELVMQALEPHIKDVLEKIAYDSVPEMMDRMLRTNINETLGTVSKELENIIWETVPDLAENMLKKELDKIRQESQ